MRRIHKQRRSPAAATRVVGAALLSCALCLTSGARADDTPLTAPREVPDYDGRPDPGDDAIDALLWVPRILLSPLYLISEYVIRRPLGFLMTELERAQIIEAIMGTLGEDQLDIGAFPTVFGEFGLDPSVGLYAYWGDFLFDGNRISVHGATWGEEFLIGTVRDRVQFGELATLSLRAQGLRRPDQIYAVQDGLYEDLPRARFAMDRAEVEVDFQLHFLESSLLRATGGFRSASFKSAVWNEDPSVGDRIGQGYAAPAAFETGFALTRFRLTATFDSHPPGGLPSSGIALGGFIEENIGVDGSDVRFGRYGAYAWGGLDVFGGSRVIELSANVEWVDPSGSGPVPFTELVDMSGGDRFALNAWPSGTLRGHSGAMASIRYRWPIWIFLNAAIVASVGNSFGPYFAGFDPGRWRLAVGLELAPGLEEELPFVFVLAVGTDPFDRGGEVNSVRLTIGTRSGL